MSSTQNDSLCYDYWWFKQKHFWKHHDSKCFGTEHMGLFVLSVGHIEFYIYSGM